MFIRRQKHFNVACIPTRKLLMMHGTTAKKLSKWLHYRKCVRVSIFLGFRGDTISALWLGVVFARSVWRERENNWCVVV